MYIIHLRGMNPLEVESSQGKRIKELWGANPKDPTPIEVNDRMFRLNEIKSIEPAPDKRYTPVERFPELTETQRLNRQKLVEKYTSDLKKKGILNSAGGTKVQVEWHKFCVVCGKENPPGMARVCSSECYLKSPL